jgi:sulfate/thiosulfate transport system ATP-binding protein
MSIEVRNVTKRFGSFVALDDVSLEIPDGSLTAVLGPSGSGKSTLLRIVAGLERPDSGEILLSGEDATRLAPQRRDVGFVFQHYAAFKHMTVRDNVGFALSIRKRPRAEIRERVDELLKLVQLEGFADRYPSKLSGGQRQRMALARALAAKPRVLLLDEPFGALDARVRAELRDWLRRLHEEVHVTTVFVTHDQEEAMEVADRVAVMDHGKLEQVGAPAELYDAPASEFVLRFVGDAVRLGDRLVRPHEIVLQRWPNDGAVEVEVERIAVLGADVRVDLVDGNGERIAARLRREHLDDLDLSSGEIVWAGTEPLLARDVETRQAFRSFDGDLDAADLRTAGPATAEAD